MNNIQNGIPGLIDVEMNIIGKISFYCRIDASQINPLNSMDQIELDSILAMTIIEELQHEYKVDIPTFLFYEHETIRASAMVIIGLMETPRI